MDQEKYCPRCKTIKPLSEWGIAPERSDGLQGYCQSCRHDYDSDLRHALRQNALDSLGGVCVACGYADARALQIDHIYGGGRVSRGSCPERFLKAVVAGTAEDLQLLCANCNIRKRLANGEHKGDRVYVRSTADREGTKFCPDCRSDVPLSEWGANKARSDGLNSYCISCIGRRNKLANRKRREELLALFDSCCSRCGETDHDVLQVDHVNGGGNVERKTLNSGSRAFMEHVTSNALDYQCLCANCNWIKRTENEERKHNYTRRTPTEKLKGVGRGNSVGGLAVLAASRTPEAQRERAQKLWATITPDEREAFGRKISAIASTRRKVANPDAPGWHWSHPDDPDYPLAA